MPISSYLPTSALAKPGVCTFSTRPASPYEGQVIYETDTDKVLVWNGSSWTPPWNTSWGVSFHTASTAGTSFSASTVLNVLNGSFTVVAGRRYMIYGRIGVQVTGTAATPNVLYVGETTLGNKTIDYDTRAITQFHCKMFQGTFLTDANAFGVTSGTSSKTINLYWRCGASGVLNTDPDAIVGSGSLPHQLTVKDVGPV